MHDGCGCAHHHHHHEHETASSAEEAKALLKYMVEHNKSHTAELEEMAGQFDGAAKESIIEAVENYKTGTALLEQALIQAEE